METIQYSLKNSKFSIDINLYKGKNGDVSYQYYKYNTQKENDKTTDKSKDKTTDESEGHSTVVEDLKKNIETSFINEVNNFKDKIKFNDDYDDYCRNVYGVRSCIFYETNPDVFEIRYLDKNKTNHIINRSKLYIYIPKLIEELYTVVIVEYLEKTHTNEIVAIHSPRA